MKFIVPGEPVGKGRPRVVRCGGRARAYTPEKTAAYENLVRLEYRRQIGDLGPLEGAVRMEIRAYCAPPRSDSRKKREAKLEGRIRPTKKPDCDNIGKIIADSLNGIAYRDDAQIVGMVVEKFYAENPRVEVEITEVRQHEGLHAVHA